MKNQLLSFFAGGLVFSTLIISTGAQSHDPISAVEKYQQVTESYDNRYYELREQLQLMELDFAKFYKKPRKGAGNRIRKNLEHLKYLTEDIQKEVYQLQQKKQRRKLLGKK